MSSNEADNEKQQVQVQCGPRVGKKQMARYRRSLKRMLERLGRNITGKVSQVEVGLVDPDENLYVAVLDNSKVRVQSFGTSKEEALSKLLCMLVGGITWKNRVPHRSVEVSPEVADQMVRSGEVRLPN